LHDELSALATGTTNDLYASPAFQPRMNDPLPPLDLLKGFEAVARHLSFTKAAAELFVTQSAVSRQVRQLEEHLGVRLFERRTRAVVLTEAGYLYYTELAPLLKKIGELTTKIAAARPVKRVRVTASMTFSSLWLVPRLAAFQEKHPDIHVHIVSDNTMRDLVRDDFDVAIRYSGKDAAGPTALELFGEQLTPVCSPKLISGGRLKRLEDLNDYVLIHFHDLEGKAQWLSWDQVLAAMNGPHVRGKGAAYFSHYDQAIRAARAAQGIVLGRFPVIDTLLQDRELIAPLQDVSTLVLPGRAYWLIVRPDGEMKPEVELFVAWLRQEAAKSAKAKLESPLRPSARRAISAKPRA
jgi:LysR family glycine cleavage system transcriptional activator